jgi:hypothetical protein
MAGEGGGAGTRPLLRRVNGLGHVEVGGQRGRYAERGARARALPFLGSGARGTCLLSAGNEQQLTHGRLGDAREARVLAPRLRIRRWGGVVARGLLALLARGRGQVEVLLLLLGRGGGRWRGGRRRGGEGRRAARVQRRVEGGAGEGRARVGALGDGGAAPAPRLGGTCAALEPACAHDMGWEGEGEER